MIDVCLSNRDSREAKHRLCPANFPTNKNTNDVKGSSVGSPDILDVSVR